MDGARSRAERGEVAPELLAHPVAELGALGGQLVVRARLPAQLDGPRGVRDEAEEGLAVGAQRVGEDASLAAVILRARGAEAIAKAISLLGIDRVDVEPLFQLRVGDGVVCYLDGDVDAVGLMLSAKSKNRAQRPATKSIYGLQRRSTAALTASDTA